MATTIPLTIETIAVSQLNNVSRPMSARRSAGLVPSMDSLLDLSRCKPAALEECSSDNEEGPQSPLTPSASDEDEEQDLKSLDDSASRSHFPHGSGADSLMLPESAVNLFPSPQPTEVMHSSPAMSSVCSSPLVSSSKAPAASSRALAFATPAPAETKTAKGIALLVIHAALVKMLAEADGRDKVMKIIQYAAKIVLYHQLVAASSPSSKRLSALASHFSITRKILRLGHWVEELPNAVAVVKGEKALYNAEKGGIQWSNVSSVLGVVNDLVDDSLCLRSMGILAPSPVAARFLEKLSASLWMSGIFIDLAAAVRSLANAQSPRQRTAQGIVTAKLIADLAFCSYDLCEFSTGSKAVPVYSAGAAALLGTYRKWTKLL
jgi:hypothetical protein